MCCVFRGYSMATGSTKTEDKEIVKRVLQLDMLADVIASARISLKSVKNTKDHPTARRDAKDEAYFTIKLIEVEHKCRMQNLSIIVDSKKPLEGLTKESVTEVAKSVAKELLKEIPLAQLERLHDRLKKK